MELLRQVSHDFFLLLSSDVTRDHGMRQDNIPEYTVSFDMPSLYYTLSTDARNLLGRYYARDCNVPSSVQIDR